MEPVEMFRSALFIIGGSRSGSQLLRHVLNASTSYAVLGEAGITKPAYRNRSVLESARSTLRSKHAVKTTEVRSWLGGDIAAAWEDERLCEEVAADVAIRMRAGVSAERASATVLDSAMRIHAEQARKPLRGAKFPLFVGDSRLLVEYFPGSQYLHCVRDPRAAFYSQVRKHVALGRMRGWMPLVWLANAAHFKFAYRGQVKADRLLVAVAGVDYMRVRYEDLLRDPPVVLGDIFRLIGEDGPVPESVAFSNSFVDSRADGGSDFDPSRVDRWRSALGPFQKWLLTLVFRRELRHFGYAS